ncbi:MAG TPA: hypothetical protein ENK22_02050 [Persephonella sp.]|nr:hypothetical protein [Persephonella sp.]
MKDKIISFRVSKSEYEILKKLAQLENKELSQLILENTLSRPVSFVKVSDNEEKIKPELEKLKREIMKLHNQIEAAKEDIEKSINETETKELNELSKLSNKVSIVNNVIHAKCNVDMLTLAFFLLIHAAAIIFILKSM